MMLRNIYAVILLSGLLTLLPTGASASSQKVDNFVLLDHRGDAHELYYQSGAGAIVLISQGNGCDIIRSQAAAIGTLRDDYAARGVQVWMINSNQDSRADINAEVAAWNIDVPVLQDTSQIIGRSLNLTRTAEVLVIDPQSWEIVYRGPLLGAEDAGQAGASYVRPILDRLLSGDQVAYSQVDAPGCSIPYSPLAAEQISYSGDIAPLLERNCLACHVDGGIAPWAMSDYRMVLGFAPMIREVVRTRRMPPWHADPEIGHWVDDAGMSVDDTRTLISWIEAGAPRGDGPDPLQELRPQAAEWPLGEPDLILAVPAYEVPASGIVDYQFPVVENPVDHESWVVAATIIPGDAKVVHHVLLGSADKAPAEGDRESVFENYIMGYAPGNESSFMPEGTGVRVPVGGVYQFQLHYTPTGKATTDQTRVGLYFADRAPANFLRQTVVLNPMLKIPPLAPNHEVSAYFEFWNDATLYSLVPHAHYRGRSSSFTLVYPDGTVEKILSVPNYDFNWQRTYKFSEPKQVPAGTRIVHRTLYDNSPNNPGNPDPQREVPWGLQSHDEMLYGSVSYAWTDETTAAPIHSKVRADTVQWMGFMDSNMDGVVQKDEMPDNLRKSIGWKFWFLDKDKDGGLNLAEMEALVERLNRG